MSKKNLKNVKKMLKEIDVKKRALYEIEKNIRETIQTSVKFMNEAKKLKKEIEKMEIVNMIDDISKTKKREKKNDK